jgi:hypothetical protein
MKHWSHWRRDKYKSTHHIPTLYIEIELILIWLMLKTAHNKDCNPNLSEDWSQLHIWLDICVSDQPKYELWKCLAKPNFNNYSCRYLWGSSLPILNTNHKQWPIRWHICRAPRALCLDQFYQSQVKVKLIASFSILIIFVYIINYLCLNYV